MKLKTQLAVLAVLALPFSLLSAAPKSAKKSAVANSAYKVDVTQSKVSWLGKKVTGQHNGTIGIKSGDLVVAGGAITGGTVELDATKIVVEDLQGEWKDKLEGHLKSDDFFSAATKPTITFQITKVEPAATDSLDVTHNVTGFLTIKGKTNPITFPAKINVASDKITAEAKAVTIDRTAFDIKYGSGKFFQGLGDKVINDNFWLDLSVVAMK